MQQSIRDHFPVRRSTRKTKTILEVKFEEKKRHLIVSITSIWNCCLPDLGIGLGNEANQEW